MYSLFNICLFCFLLFMSTRANNSGVIFVAIDTSTSQSPLLSTFVQYLAWMFHETPGALLSPFLGALWNPQCMSFAKPITYGLHRPLTWVFHEPSYTEASWSPLLRNFVNPLAQVFCKASYLGYTQSLWLGPSWSPQGYCKTIHLIPRGFTKTAGALKGIHMQFFLQIQMVLNKAPLYGSFMKSIPHRSMVGVNVAKQFLNKN